MEKSTNAMEKASCAMEDAAPMGEGISRRSFLGLGALGAASSIAQLVFSIAFVLFSTGTLLCRCLFP